MMLIKKLLLGFNALLGFLYKLLIDCYLYKIPALNENKNADIIVSLTSYGRRVKNNVVYYTLASILRQKIQPKKIVLWLAEEEWKDEKIPEKLKRLRNKGVDICYCKDIKSYKKLIPSLLKYPQSSIITLDDDIIYSKDTIEKMMEAHISHPSDIICTVARKPYFKDGIPCYYNNWEDSLIKPFKNGTKGRFLFPVGVGGVLYPAGSLHNDVINEKIFMDFCPNADDVWFWFCGLRNNTNKRYITKNGLDLSFDSLYQYFHKGTALTHINNLQHQNDNQLQLIFDYYNYRIDNE